MCLLSRALRMSSVHLSLVPNIKHCVNPMNELQIRKSTKWLPLLGIIVLIIYIALKKSLEMRRNNKNKDKMPELSFIKFIIIIVHLYTYLVKHKYSS